MESPALTERTTLCLAGSTRGIASHNHDKGFQAALQKHLSNAESNANERLVRLKAKLAMASMDDFWKELMEGMTSITGAQYAFVAKRILVDDCR